MKVTLERFAYLPNGTLGKIEELGIYVLERPWKNNAPNISCIPEGIYQVGVDQEGRYTGFPELQNVPGRTEIIVHAANHVHEIQGCLAPGITWTIDDSPHVWSSGDALQVFLGARVTQIEITSTVATI